MPQETLIKTTNLSKQFNRKTILHSINLNIKAGDIYALIGPNGSGKTTLIKCLTGLLRPDSGSAQIAGFDITKHPLQAKASFGYVPDNPQIYPYLSGAEFIKLTASLQGLDQTQTTNKLENLEKIFPVSQVINQTSGSYSRGSLQKTALLAALVHSPKVLIIDEPIVGLDPASIKILGQQLQVFAQNGGAVLFVTHILDFATDYANRAGILIEGKLKQEIKVTSQTSLSKLYQKYL